MNEAIAFLCVLWMTFVGYMVIAFFQLLEKSSVIEKLPFSFGLGAGLLAMQLYFYSRFHLSWNSFLLLAPWIIFCIFFNIRKLSLHERLVPIKNSLFFFDKVLVIFIVLLSLFVLIEAMIRPVTAWDGWASWLFRAKIFFIDGSIKSDVFQYIPSEYPLLVNLMSTYIYIFLGAVDDRSVLLLYPAFYIFLAILFFFSLRPTLGNTKGILFTFLLMSTQNIIRHSGRYEAGQADIVQGFYIFISSLLCIRYLQSKNIRVMVLLQIFLTITSLIKNEGVPYVIFIEVFLSIFLLNNKLYVHFLCFLFWLVPFIDWQLYKSFLHLPQAPSYLHFSFHPDRFFYIIEVFTKEFLNVQNWNLLWPSFFISFTLFAFSKKDLYLLVLYLLIFLQLGIYIGVFFFTSVDPFLHVPNVANRVLLHLAPVALCALSMTYAHFDNDFELTMYLRSKQFRSFRKFISRGIITK